MGDNRLKRLCVFCGANAGNGPRYSEAAETLGHALVRADIGLVYGGAGIGLMGVIADAVRNGGGEVIGVIPQNLVEREVAHRKIEDLRVVDSMHERKALMRLHPGTKTHETLGNACQMCLPTDIQSLFSFNKPSPLVKTRGEGF